MIEILAFKRFYYTHSADRVYVVTTALFLLDINLEISCRFQNNFNLYKTNVGKLYQTLT